MKNQSQAVLSCGPSSILPGAGVPAVVMWDINSPDIARARAFYSGVFAWAISEPGAAPVRLATVESGPGGISGVMGQAPSETDHDAGLRHRGLIVYIKVRDVAETLAAIGSSGGRTIWGPTEVAPGFWLAQFEDPDGVRLGLST